MALAPVQKFAFSVGHILNDLCATMWFSYLLIFLHKVLLFSNSMAGYLLLIGQIADGLATPFVGYESDKSSINCRYGRRKSWHLIGTVCVTLAFPLLFLRCVGCSENTAEYAQFLYYAPLVVIFQIGWASTQINHLALIPDITNNVEKDNVDLNSYRYGFTVTSSIAVYSIAWLVLDIPGSSQSSNHVLSPADAYSFRNLVLTVVGIGVVFSMIFHVVLKEKPRPHPGMTINEEREETEHSVGASTDKLSETSPLLNPETLPTPADLEEPSSRPKLLWYEWFKQPSFYVIACLYMLTRLVVNLSQIYMPMYLTDTLKMSKQYIAIVPLVTYMSGFVSTFVVRQITKVLKHEPTYVVGAMFLLGSCVWAYFLEENSNQVFGQAVLLGIGTSIMLIMSLAMTTSLIGSESGTGAFVYGAMSFTDKVSNGVAVVIIQHLNPCLCNCPECASYFRTLMTYLLGALTLATLVTLSVLLWMKKYAKDRSAS